MRKFMLVTAVMGFSCLPLAAQDYPKGEVAGTYTYVRVNPGGGIPGQNCHGGGGSIAGNVNSYFGVVGEFSGCKVTGLPSGSPSITALTYLFGPRLTYRGSGKFEPFAEALFGGARFSGGGTSDNAFSMAIGGGADYKVSRNVAIRLGQFDYLYTKFNEGSGAPQHQNNFRIQVGIVFRFGER